MIRNSMIVQFDDILIKNNILIHGGKIELEKNRIYAVLGANGVGKTLLLKRLFQECLNNDSCASYIEQDNDCMIKKCSLLENIAMTRDKNICEKAKELVKKYNLEYLLQHNVTELSGGEKRIICLLRAIFQQAEIIFVDEPTNDLDYNMVKKVQDIFWDIQQYCTIVMITHDDRMEEIATDIWTIKDQNVVCDKNKNIILLKKISKKCLSGGHNDLFLKNILSFDVSSIVILFIMSLLCIYMLYTYLPSQNQVLSYVADNEIQVFIPDSEIGNALLTEGAIPISAVSCFDDTLTKKEQLNILNSCLEMSKVQPINFGLDQLDCQENKKLELEYYDLKNSVYYSTLEYFKTYYGNEQSNYFDTSEYFLLDEITKEDGLVFSIEAFEKCRLKMLEETEGLLECSFVVLCLDKSEDFISFIQKGNLNEIINGNFYIRSNETIEFYNQIMSFQGNRMLIINMMVFGTFFLLISSLSYYVLLFANRKKLMCYKNIGKKKNTAIQIIQEKYNNTKIKIIMLTGVLVVTLVLLVWKGNPMLSGAYMNVLVFTFLLRLDSKIRKQIGKRFVEKVWDWRYR